MEDIVKVEWKDARTFTDVIREEDLIKENLVTVTTIGILVKRDKEKVIVGSMKFEDEGQVVYKISHLIPLKLIKKITQLR